MPLAVVRTRAGLSRGEPDSEPAATSNNLERRILKDAPGHPGLEIGWARRVRRRADCQWADPRIFSATETRNFFNLKFLIST